ncbi:hypothetical protein GGF46_005546 [Coemansia sp. RSA 552]|nr:hypothetical protein GGF46_005546 [Coemansia sp. RSA 552]
MTQAVPTELVGEVRSGHELDIGRLSAFLKQSAVDIELPIELKQFKVGQSNPTFLVVDARGQRFVLRKKPPGQLVSKTAHAVEREFRILDALGRHSRVPVPRVYALCEDVAVVGTPFYLMEFLNGRVLSDVRLPEIPPHERQLYWGALVDAAAELHQVDFRAVGLGDYGRVGGFYQRQLRSLTRVAEAQAQVADKAGVQVGELPRFGELRRWFAQQQCPDETTIVHGDFKMDNVVWHPTEARIVGILDWELSTLGNPRTDLANMLQPLLVPYDSNTEPNSVLQGLQNAPAEEMPPSTDTLLRRYCARVGREFPLDGWSFATVFGLFRNAVILQGVAARLAKGQASSSFAHVVALLFPRVMALAMRIVDGQEAATRRSKL